MVRHLKGTVTSQLCSRSFRACFLAVGLVATGFADDSADPPSPVPVGEATQRMSVPDGFQVTLFAGEPDVVQPIAITTDDRGQISRYAIKDPSFNNWTGLAIAVRNNLVADFPLCNKSFNLSYSGNDL